MTGRQPDRLDPVTRMVGLTVVLGSVMSLLDTTSVNVALHDLAGDFGVSVTEVHWVASAYLLALAVAIPLSGWASARFGGRRVWMTSVSIFLTGSILAGISWSLGSLIAFRILQGFGGGMILPVGMAMLVRTAGPGRVGRALGILGIAQLLGPVLGPVLGGLLVQDGGWRWIFYVNVPIGALALVLAARHLPTHPPDPSERLDLKGFAFLSPGLAGLVYGLASISNGGVGRGPGTRANACGHCAGRCLRDPRPAHIESPDRRAPLRAASLCLYRGHRPVPRHQPVRGDVPASALLPERPGGRVLATRACSSLHRASVPR